MSFTSKRLPVLGVIGTSGSGKSTIIRKLHDLGIIQVNPTWTTRPPRPDDEELGVEHVFVSDADFDRKAQNGDFIEVVSMFGLPFRYAVPRLAASRPGRPSLLMLRVSLLPLLVKHYPNHLLYHIEGEAADVASRLKKREAGGEALGTRIEDIAAELETGRAVAARIFVNKDIDKTVEAIRQAVMEDFK